MRNQLTEIDLNKVTSGQILIQPTSFFAALFIIITRTVKI